MQPIAHRDIWSEILQYFDISLVDDGREELGVKRRTIFSIALTCSGLVEVALDELWRSMTSLEPILCVFNASLASSTNGFVYQSQEYWEISLSPAEMGFCLPWVCSYLSRIHYLHFSSFPTRREYTLWRALSSIKHFPSLCPNLRRLYLGMGIGSPGRIYNLNALISPSLRGIIFANSVFENPDGVAASVLLSTLKYLNIDVLEVSYRGFTSSRIVRHIFQFPSLHSISIQSTQRHNSLLLDDSDIKSFPTLAYLTTLDIDLGIYHTDAGVGDWIASMQSLSTLRLCGSWPDIHRCTRGHTLTTICSLSLSLALEGRPTTFPSGQRMDVFSEISDAFPKLQSLCLELWNTNLTQPKNGATTLTDILTLREKPMKSIDFRQLYVSLSTADIIDMITVWPSLRHLSIIPLPACNVVFDAHALLSHMSRHAPHLHDLNVPLDLTGLFGTRSMMSDMCVCPLQRLELTQAQNIPYTLVGKLTLSRNLISLFPRLSAVTSLYGNSNVKDMQEIIKLLQDVMSSPPRRHDKLFQD